MGGNASVRVEYTVAAVASAPPSTSLAWLVADVVTGSSGSVLTPAQLYTARVWVRALGLNSSDDIATPYTTPVYIDVDDVARFSGLSIVLADRIPVISWVAGSLTLGVLVEWEVHASDEEPGSLANSAEVDADDDGYVIGAILTLGQAVTVTVTAYDGWDASTAALEGSPGQTVTQTLLAVPADRVEVRTLTDVDLDTGASYSVTADDEDTHLIITTASGVTVYLSSYAEEPVPVGATLWIEQGGAGPVIIMGLSDVTVRAEGGRQTTTGQYAIAMLRHVALAEWTITGDLGS